MCAIAQSIISKKVSLLAASIIRSSVPKYIVVIVTIINSKMVSIRHIITLPISAVAFVATFYIIGQLMFFLSVPLKIQPQYLWILNLIDNYSRLEMTVQPLTQNLALIIVFILQHSLMRSNIVSWFWQKCGLSTIERSIYNLATAASLYVCILILSCNDVINLKISLAVTRTHFSKIVVAEQMEKGTYIFVVANRC